MPRAAMFSVEGRDPGGMRTLNGPLVAQGQKVTKHDASHFVHSDFHWGLL